GASVRWDGINWLPQATPVTDRLNTVWSSSRHDVWAVGEERGRAPQGAVTRLTLPPPGCDARAVLRRMPRALAAAAVFAACTCDGVAAATPAWKTLEPGLSYARVERAGTKFHLVRADLATHELAVADARRDERKVARVDVLRAEAAALAAV